MPSFTALLTGADLAPFKAFAEALAIGLLIGVERYKDREPDERAAAGIRTFAIIALLGAICGLLGEAAFTLATFGALAALVALGYYREAPESIGLTTEITALITFWLGYVVHDHEVLAIAAGIVLVILLASKRTLHEFVRGKVSDAEFYDTLKFLTVVFVVLPLLPNRALGPLGFFNPVKVWMLVILVSTISYGGYVLMRLMGRARGLAASALVGGLVSTTAVTLSLAERAKRAPALTRACGVSGVLANAVQFPRLLVLVWVVDPRLGRLLALPLLGGFAAGLLGAWVLGTLRRKQDEPELDVALSNPYSLAAALRFAAMFIVVLFAARAAALWLGDRGLFLASAIAGLVDASAISLSAADMAVRAQLTTASAAVAVLIAISTNAALKWTLAILNGTRELAFWLGGGFVTMVGTAALALALCLGA